MKELSIEQKARRYDKAIARANEMIKAMTNIGGVAKVDDIQYIFPELKASDDEKVKKAIIKFVRKNGSFSYCLGISTEEAIAWLEKQGQKSADKVEKAMNDAGYVWDDEKKEVRKVVQKSTDLPKGEDYGIDGLDNAIRILEKTLGKVEGYQTDDGILEHKCAISAVKNLYEQKSGWGEEEEKDLFNAAKHLREYAERCVQGEYSKIEIFSLADRIESFRPQPTQEAEPFEAEHGKYYYCIKDYFCGGKKQASKGDVVQALRGLPIMGLKDASEYFLPVNFIKCNYTWSEEDETKLKSIIALLKSPSLCDMDANKGIIDESIKYLKSIKDRVLTQPKQEWSEEDELMLNDIIMCGERHCYLDAGNISWLKVLKNRVLPKQEWSEEDEHTMSKLLSLLLTNHPEMWAMFGNWLKCLKERYTWKPSEEQLIQLSNASNGLYYNCETLLSLLEQLKKLREE